MSAPLAPPHRQVLDRPGFHALVAAASLLLSWWAVYADPVINSDGIGEVRAARYFLDADWRAGIELSAQPLYALLGAALSRVAGLDAAAGLYAVNAVLFALLAVGFLVLVSVLGGGRRAGWLGALLILLFPSLIGLRPGINGDPGYWAFYLWSLGYAMHYVRTRDKRSLMGWVLAGVAAVMFAVEALVILIPAGLWLLVHEQEGARGRALKWLAVAAAAAVLLVEVLWGQAWHSDFPAGPLLPDPLTTLAAAWHELGREITFRLEALQTQFLDQYSHGYDNTALVVALLVVAASGVLACLGPIYAVLAAYAAAVSARTLEPGQKYWWRVFAVLSMLTLLAPALTRFSVSGRDAMIAGLTLTAIVPPALDSLWQRCSSGPGPRRWLPPLIAAAVIASGIAALDLRSGQVYLRDAGRWLRDNASPDATLYSNSPVIVYYSGLDGYRPGDEYTWQEAMATVWGDRWREYRYLALVIDAENAHREGILLRKLELAPVKTILGESGSRVLIFAVDGDG
ncbi:MAG TPA: hypothetical protein VK973_17445 [Arenicellales bacterium]|nr:hypothetical protein [Arenicellales bacterium]